MDTVTISTEGQILDSGDRTQFVTGAVRDMRIGKGRMDLIPWDCSVMSEWFPDDMILQNIIKFWETKDKKYLATVMYDFSSQHFGDPETALIELSKHFEAGAEKYGEYNWQKGIPTHCYIDSALRHYMKYRRGDDDERHDRAFLWNIVCLIWTSEHLPNCDDLALRFSLRRTLVRIKTGIELFIHRMKLRIKLFKNPTEN